MILLPTIGRIFRIICHYFRFSCRWASLYVFLAYTVGCEELSKRRVLRLLLLLRYIICTDLSQADGFWQNVPFLAAFQGNRISMLE